jgi:hypothetical protein
MATFRNSDSYILGKLYSSPGAQDQLADVVLPSY